MNFWLVGLGLALLCTVSAESECSGDLHQMLGKWYAVLMATDCKKILNHKDEMNIIPGHVSAETDSKLVITTKFPKEDGCQELKLVFDKLDDGTYVHSSSSDWGSTKKMEVVSTDCKTYVLLRAQMEHKEKISDHLVLYSRKPETPSELSEKFFKTARNSGFTEDQIIIPHGVACEDED